MSLDIEAVTAASAAHRAHARACTEGCAQIGTANHESAYGPRRCAEGQRLFREWNSYRPRKLIGNRTAPDGRELSWGVIVRIHELGVYQIVEYKRDNSTLTDVQSWAEHGKVQFHPYLDRKDTSHAYETLEEAIVGVIAYAKQGPNSQAGFFAAKILGLHDEVA